MWCPRVLLLVRVLVVVCVVSVTLLVVLMVAAHDGGGDFAIASHFTQLITRLQEMRVSYHAEMTRVVFSIPANKKRLKRHASCVGSDA